MDNKKRDIIPNLEMRIEQSETSNIVNTELLIAKKDKTDKGETRYSAVAGAFYTEKVGASDFLNSTAVAHFKLPRTLRDSNGRVLKQNEKIYLDLDYDHKMDRGEYYTQLSFREKREVILDETKVNKPSIIADVSGEELKDMIYEEIVESTVIPMFPILTKPKQLSKELFVTEERAEEILKNLEDGKIESKYEEMALDGISKYKAWRDYIVEKLIENNVVRELYVLIAPINNFSAYEIVMDSNVIKEVISNGVKNGSLQISNKSVHRKHYTEFDSYMEDYAPLYKKVIESQLVPLHKTGDISKLSQAVMKGMTRKPFGAQIDAIEAMKKSLQHQNKVDIIGEPGVGKTLMMIASTLIDSLRRRQPMKSLILAPDHLVDSTWREEIEVSYKNMIKAHFIKSVSDLLKYKELGYFDDKVNRAFILGQNDAKSGYRMKPAVHWNTFQVRFECTDCGAPVTGKKRVRNDRTGKFEDVVYNRAINFFNKERDNNKKCTKCQSSFWQPINNSALPGGFKSFISGEEVKINENKMDFVYTEIGYLPRDGRRMEEFIKRTELTYTTSSSGSVVPLTKRHKKVLDNFKKALKIVKGEEKPKRPISPKKVPLSMYIRKKMKNHFTHLICDELHEYQNANSSRSMSLVDLVTTIPVIVRGTGTLMNGYARSRFFNDFIMYPEKLKRAGFSHNDIESYQASFGVVEKSYKLNRKTNKRSANYSKQKPGISPVIFPMFLQDSSVFINMADLESDLPKLTREDPISVYADDEVKRGYDGLAQAIAKSGSRNGRSFSSKIPALYAYLDMPTIQREIKDEDGNVLHTTKPVSPSVDRKLEELIKIIEQNKASGRRVIVYTHYTSDGVNNYLSNKLKEEGFNVTTLNKEGEQSMSTTGDLVRVKKDNREAFVKEEVKKGADVLIVNPTLVQTGVNLIDFHSIVYYQLSYQVYTIRQADRRTWRIGQTKDCSIYFLYYKDTIQEDIAKLMATKIVAAEAIEGDMDADGLASITDTRTPEEELAQKFYEKMSVLS